jgi:hypothetical protein
MIHNPFSRSIYLSFESHNFKTPDEYFHQQQIPMNPLSATNKVDRMSTCAVYGPQMNATSSTNNVDKMDIKTAPGMSLPQNFNRNHNNKIITRQELTAFLEKTIMQSFCDKHYNCNVESVHPSTAPFINNYTPSISVCDYFQRIVKYTMASNEALVIAIVYLCRINDKVPTFQIYHGTIYRVLLASIRVSTKYHDEDHLDNKHFAKVGGVNVKEMNSLEADFLYLIGFDLYVSSDDYLTAFKHIMKSIHGVDPLPASSEADRTSVCTEQGPQMNPKTASSEADRMSVTTTSSVSSLDSQQQTHI